MIVELGEMHSGLAVEKRIMGWLGKLEKRLEENRNQIYIQMYINLQKNKTIYIYIYINIWRVWFQNAINAIFKENEFPPKSVLSVLKSILKSILLKSVFYTKCDICHFILSCFLPFFQTATNASFPSQQKAINTLNKSHRTIPRWGCNDKKISEPIWSEKSEDCPIPIRYQHSCFFLSI